MKLFQNLNPKYHQAVITAVIIGLPLVTIALHLAGQTFAGFAVLAVLGWTMIVNAIMFKSWLKTFDAMILWAVPLGAIIAMIYYNGYTNNIVDQMRFVHVIQAIVGIGVLWAVIKKIKDVRKRLGK